MKETHISPFTIISAALIMFFFLYFLITLFFIDIKFIRGESMEPVFSSGDIIFVNKIAYGLLIPFKNEYITHWASPERGDIILFLNPEGDNKEGNMLVKRCIAIEGDPVNYREGNLSIAKRSIPFNPIEHYLFDTSSPSVPEKMIFVMGDNHRQSIDSRHFGFIHISRVYGKVIRCIK